jgi:hypothetical protein
MSRMRDIFTIVRHMDYITLYFLGDFKGNYDNDNEIEEAKREILGY